MFLERAPSAATGAKGTCVVRSAYKCMMYQERRRARIVKGLRTHAGRTLRFWSSHFAVIQCRFDQQRLNWGKGNGMNGSEGGRLDRWAAWASPCLTVVFGMQMLRVLFPSFVGFLRDAQGVDALNLAPLALAVFAPGFLAAALRHLLGHRRVLTLTAGGLALVRLAEQFSRSPWGDLILSAIGVALLTLYLPNALGSSRRRSSCFASAFLLGLAVDSAIQIGGRTLDLSWHAGVLPLILVTLLAAAALAALWRVLRSELPFGAPDSNWRSDLVLIGLGPWLFLQLQVYQNTARVSALTGWETPAAGALVLLGGTLGLLAARWMADWTGRRNVAGAALGLALLLLLIVPEPAGTTAALLLLMGQVVSFALGYLLLTNPAQGEVRTGLGRLTISVSTSGVLLVLLIFAYYVTYDIALGFRATVLLPAAAALVAIAAAGVAPGGGSQEVGQPGLWPAAAALVLLVVPLGLAAAWEAPQFIEPDPSNRSVRVMDYNVHNGFDITGRLDLEAIAQLVEENDVDVLGLQEISRGWLIWGGADMLLWFSQRLGMPYVNGPTADAQWGNAVLSRYPILSSETRPLPPERLLIRRGTVQANIDVGGGQLSLINTHFAHRGSSAPARLEQAHTLVGRWLGAPQTVVTGDFNAAPDSEAMAVLIQAGLVNVAGEACPPPVLTSPAKAPRRQIDYIWATADLAYEDCAVPTQAASDHLPVVATISLP